MPPLLGFLFSSVFVLVEFENLSGISVLSNPSASVFTQIQEIADYIVN